MAGFACCVALRAEERRATFSVVSVLAVDEAFSRPHDVELSGDLAFVAGKGGVDRDRRRGGTRGAPKVLWSKLDPKGLDEAETVLPLGRSLLLGTRDLLVLDVAEPRRPVWKARDRRPGAGGQDQRDGAVRRPRLCGVQARAGSPCSTSAIRRHPRLVDSLNVREAHGLVSPHDVDVFGDYVVVVDPDGFGRNGRPGKLGVLSVIDPSTRELLPAARWKLEGLVVNTDLVGANRVQVSGNHAYVTGSQGEVSSNMVVVDLADPTAPRQVAVLSSSATRGPNGPDGVGRRPFPRRAGGPSRPSTSPSRIARSSSRRSNFPRCSPKGVTTPTTWSTATAYLYVTAQNSHRFAILKVHGRQIPRLAARGPLLTPAQPMNARGPAKSRGMQPPGLERDHWPCRGQ